MTIDYSTKIQALEKKIQEYQTKYPQRTWEQKQELSSLFLELVYWQLVEKGEIKPDPLFFKVEGFWLTLKKSYQNKGKWPVELKDFLTKQPKEYTEYLISFIQQEDEKECLKLGRWLSKNF